jgi:hypothetical protein
MNFWDELAKWKLEYEKKNSKDPCREIGNYQYEILKGIKSI